MAAEHSCVKPNAHLFLRLQNELLRLVQIKPNTIIDLGKLGSFPANLLLGRPYHVTYEVLDPQAGESFARIRPIPASELNADVVAEEASAEETRTEVGTPVGNGSTPALGPSTFDPNAEIRNNRLTIDDPTRQTLTHEEIEELKRSAGGKEVIERLLASHTGLDEKTAYSKAKYLVRKRNKFLKRFTVLPMDLSGLMQYISFKEPQRILELRDETLGLIASWSNAHYTDTAAASDGETSNKGRWLVVEDTGGLIVATLAERMNLLHAYADAVVANKPSTSTSDVQMTEDSAIDDATEFSKPQVNGRNQHQDFPMPDTNNTITIIHSATQPNVAMLKYFGFDINDPTPQHPLSTHLKALSWLQLLHPEQDNTYREPAAPSEAESKEWRSGKRGTYWRKRRRWQRCAAIVDETRAGGFDGLVVASSMEPVAVLKHTLHLLRGGATVVVYSSTIESLVNLLDLFSKERKVAYMQHLSKGEDPEEEDFPLDPRQLLGPMLQTSRTREYQVLPGRTHPVMTAKGGPEGYVFTARKAIPVDGVIEARGTHIWKRRKVDTLVSTPNESS